MKKALLIGPVVFAAFAAPADATCTPTGFYRDSINMTAALINPGNVTGTVDATGCNIGVYYDHNGSGGTVKGAEIFGANYFGVLVNGDSGSVAVDVLNSSVHDIGEIPFNGTQHGVAVYYRAFFLGGSATGKISGNSVSAYQKGGIAVNGVGSNAIVSDNIVSGNGSIGYIAQNGIQFGYGAAGSAMRNTVTGHSYTGTSTVSGGIIVVGGAGYGNCPDLNPCPYTTGVQIVQNKLAGNDIGIWLSNIDHESAAPTTQTNVKVVNNVISNDALNNNYYGAGYQAGVADQGTNDKIINNTVTGAGYDPASYPSAWVYKIDADPSFTNKPKVHANK